MSLLSSIRSLLNELPLWFFSASLVFLFSAETQPHRSNMIFRIPVSWLWIVTIFIFDGVLSRTANQPLPDFLSWIPRYSQYGIELLLTSTKHFVYFLEEALVDTLIEILNNTVEFVKFLCWCFFKMTMNDYKIFKQATRTMILLVCVGSIVI